MADTLEDVKLTPKNFVDLYDSSGISVGSALAVQNKSSEVVLFTITPTQPTFDSSNGIYVEPFEIFQLTAGESGLWAKGFGTVSVQPI
jgi:hypothetical protein